MIDSAFALDTPLGKSIAVVAEYTPELLCPIAREGSRLDLGLSAQVLPFTGVDTWNLYEVSWLNQQGKPLVAMGRLQVPCDSACLIESKSLKLYLNSFNQSRFASMDAVARTIQDDLSARLGAAVALQLWLPSEPESQITGSMQGQCLDDIEVAIDSYKPKASYLTVDAGNEVSQQLYTDLFRSLCPVTGQPDWGSINIIYRGQPINHEGLLKYLVSFRDHNGFHEQCVEKIFVDIMRHCEPQRLTVYANFLRRGGVDINPFRSNTGERVPLDRLIRQ
jgi:7-cyano-7-deazaguanine reductase